MLINSLVYLMKRNKSKYAYSQKWLRVQTVIDSLHCVLTVIDGLKCVLTASDGLQCVLTANDGFQSVLTASDGLQCVLTASDDLQYVLTASDGLQCVPTANVCVSLSAFKETKRLYLHHNDKTIRNDYRYNCLILISHIALTV